MRTPLLTWPRALLAASVLVVAAPEQSHSDSEPGLHVRARADLANCLRHAADAFAAARGVEVAFEGGAAVPAQGVDVLVANSREATRAIEGGFADESASVVVGKVKRSGRERTVTALVLSAAPHPTVAAAFLEFLKGDAVRASFETCAGERAASAEGRAGLRSVGGDVHALNAPSGAFAQAVVDWWIPKCSAAYNHARYGDPQNVLGAPDAVNLGVKDEYNGITSLGQGGYVVVDMGHSVVDQPGDDIRVYQMTSNEPVTLYASDNATGPFRLIARQRECGERTPGIKANHCDFDLAEGQVSSARYFKIEDGEIYPCIAGGTATEGADIDAIEVLTP
jgi:hypothetical protein